jgi:2-dehydro-3-deoxygluconokinase
MSRAEFPIAFTGKVLSFGELLLRICPDAEGDWLENGQLSFHVGGAELNVASALALWGLPSKYFTALPNNNLSVQIIGFLNNKRIDTSAIQLTGDRIGLYFLTQGKDLKHNALIYDRANSSFAGLQPGQIDWDNLLKGVSWFHFSAICPAINQNLADLCLEAVKAASERNITISVDLNYRSKLWQYGKLPNEIMPELVSYCDLVMGNIWAIETMLQIPVLENIHQLASKTIYLEQAKDTSEILIKTYPNCKMVTNTYRFDNVNNIKYYSTLYYNSHFYVSKEYETSIVVDRVGSGDCFMAGLIYGFYNNLSHQDQLEFATAAAYGKLLCKGDATTQTVTDIKNSIK